MGGEEIGQVRREEEEREQGGEEKGRRKGREISLPQSFLKVGAYD